MGTSGQRTRAPGAAHGDCAQLAVTDVRQRRRNWREVVIDAPAEEVATAACQVTYLGSTGAPHTLTLDDVVDRLFDLSFDPYHCPELRWGAPDKSDEASTCKRLAPQAQRGKMTEYRTWFQERRRPPRV